MVPMLITGFFSVHGREEYGEGPTALMCMWIRPSDKGDKGKGWLGKCEKVTHLAAVPA